MTAGPRRRPRPLGWLRRRTRGNRVPVGTHDFDGPPPGDSGGDDGLAGDREPRRPFPPTGSMSAALEPPTEG
jgi:hypothetical protein